MKTPLPWPDSHTAVLLLPAPQGLLAFLRNYDSCRGQPLRQQIFTDSSSAAIVHGEGSSIA